MAKVMNILVYIWNFTVFFISNIYGLFAYLMWTTILLPLRFLWPEMFWKIEAFIFRALQSLVVLWLMTGKYGVIEYGDDISKLQETEAVLLANHQSTADAPLVMLTLWNKGRVSGNTLWIMDYLFRFTNFGLISFIRHDFFIKQGKDTRHIQGQLLSEHLLKFFLPQGRKWIILFPEGGFLHKRLESSQNYAKKNGYPLLQKVTLPRIGALKSIIDSLGAPLEDISDASSGDSLANGCYTGDDAQRPIRWLVDMTIAYSNMEGSPPDMFGMCIGYRVPQDIHVHYRIFPVSGVPRDNDGMLRWLYNRYEEKDQLLDYFETHGHFPLGSSEGPSQLKQPRKIIYDWINIFLYQVFFISSAYIQYTFIIHPLLSLC